MVTKKIKGIQQLTKNPHLNLYHLDALDRKENVFDYYFASRNSMERLKLFTVSLEEKRQECEETEEIHVVLADKKEVRRILSEERVSLRGAYLMMQYLHMEEEKPFAFLE